MTDTAVRATFVLIVGWLVSWLAPAHADALSLVPVVFFGLATVGTTAGVAGNINEAMKVHFVDPLFNNVVYDSDFLDLFEKDDRVQTSRTTGGRYIETAQYFQFPAGVGARALEGDYIPVPDGPVIKNSQVFLKKVEGVTEMSGDAYRRVKDDKNAWLDWAEDALTKIAERVSNELDRMLLGYGAGIRCRVNEVNPVTDAVLPIDSALGLAGYLHPGLDFMEGERVVFGPNANGTGLRTGGGTRSRKVNKVDIRGNVLTLDATPPSDVVDNDFIFGGDESGVSTQAAGVDRELMGLLGMVDNGSILATFQGLVRADFTLWNAVVVDSTAAVGAGFTEDHLAFADDEVMVLGKGNPTMIIASRRALRSYWADLKASRTINDPKSFTGGRSDLFVWLGTKRIKLRAPRKMPDNLAFMLDLTSFRRWASLDWEWDDTTGSIWNRVTDATGRKDAYYAVGHLVQQTGCIAPRKNVRLENITFA